MDMYPALVRVSEGSSILFRSEFDLLARVPPVFFGEAELKEGIKLSAFFSERVA